MVNPPDPTAPGALVGTSALVTGASRGIGEACARRLASEGARVWLLARNEARVAELALELRGEALPADLGDARSTARAMDRLREALEGAPDVIVNAAGVFSLSPLAETSVEDLDLNLAINLRGTFLVVNAVLPDMLRRASGLIVNIGSVAGRTAFPDNGAYSASKFGLRGLHEVLLEEVRGTGVRASLVEPGACDTPLWDALDPDANPALPSRTDMLAPADVADAVLFLATRPAGVQIPLLQIERSSRTT